MRLIGFAGRMHSGKDTAYQVLSRYSVREKSCEAVFRRVAFADPLKFAALNAFGGAHANYWGSPQDKNEIVHPWGVSGRQILQFMGTEMFRDTVSNLVPGLGSNFWVRRLEQEIHTHDPEIIHCITDVRFQNEADWIIDNNGIIIGISRDGMPFGNGIEGHRSEQGFTVKERYHEVINNGTREQLLEELLKIITQYFALYTAK